MENPSDELTPLSKKKKVNLNGSSRATGNLNLNVRNDAARPGQICGTGVGVLGVVIGDSRLDSILGKHGAVH